MIGFEWVDRVLLNIEEEIEEIHDLPITPDRGDMKQRRLGGDLL
jgi:hypothetical protein